MKEWKGKSAASRYTLLAVELGTDPGARCGCNDEDTTADIRTPYSSDKHSIQH